MYYVYILLCNDKRTYVGSCFDLRERLNLHSNGKVSATKNRLPIKLFSYFAFSDKYTMYKFEKYLKSGSGRSFIKKHFLQRINHIYQP